MKKCTYTLHAGTDRGIYKKNSPHGDKHHILSKRCPRVNFYEFPRNLIITEQFQRFSDFPDDITHLSIPGFVYNFPNLLSKGPQEGEEFIKKQSMLEMIDISKILAAAILRLRHESKQKPPFFLSLPQLKKNKIVPYDTSFYREERNTF